MIRLYTYHVFPTGTRSIQCGLYIITCDFYLFFQGFSRYFKIIVPTTLTRNSNDISDFQRSSIIQYIISNFSRTFSCKILNCFHIFSLLFFMT